MLSPAADAARQRAKRARVRSALLAEHGDRCACGAPAEVFARTDALPRGRTARELRRALDLGPSDRGLTSRPDLIRASMSGRVPMCRPCHGRSR